MNFEKFSQNFPSNIAVIPIKIIIVIVAISVQRVKTPSKITLSDMRPDEVFLIKLKFVKFDFM